MTARELWRLCDQRTRASRRISLQNSLQRGAVERLDQEPVHAGGEAGLAVFGKGVGGERDDRRPAGAVLASRATRIRRVASSPSMPGICTSIRTRS